MGNNQSEINERRKQRQKKARKKHRKVLFVLLLILMVIIFVILSVTVLFPIKNVSASGSKIYTSEQIINAANLKDSNIFAFGEKKTENRIRKELPFVDEIEFTRKLFDGISIKVKDAEEFANYFCDNSYYVVSKNKYVLYKDKNPKEDLLTITSKTAVCKVGEAITYKSDEENEVIEQITAFAKEKNIELNTLDVSEINDIKAKVNGKYDVEFGTKSYLDKKCLHLKGMLDDIDKDIEGTINLSMWTPKKSEGTFIKKTE